MIYSKTVLCSFCSAELFDENDALIEYKKAYIHDSTCLYDAYWFDIHNRVRCRSCDGVIGEQLRLNNNPFYFIVWCGKIEDEPSNEDEMQLAALFLKCFAQVFQCISKKLFYFSNAIRLPSISSSHC